MIDKVYIDYLKILHGSYNTIMASIFLYHGSLGWRIRRERKAEGKRDFEVVRRHRRRGPYIAVLGVLGYLAGLVLVYIDKGRLLEYPLHTLAGSSLALFIIATFVISRKIKGPESPWRTPHFIMGLVILLLYIIQIFIGLNILL